jgi:PadR family transcriptional regulator PadR
MYRDAQEAHDEDTRFHRFFRGPPLRGVIPIAVLSLIKDKPAHGGEIFQSLQGKYDIDVARPVIYMLLRRLERYGLMLSSWDIQENGPARRRYIITEEGLDHLNYGLERLKKVRKTITLLTGDKP